MRSISRRRLLLAPAAYAILKPFVDGLEARADGLRPPDVASPDAANRCGRPRLAGGPITGPHADLHGGRTWTLAVR